jgi:telomerase reverse transcriptase
VFSLYPNQHVQMLKESPWPQLLVLLGNAGEKIMIDLLADCSVFTSVKAGHGNLFQLSGESMAELKPTLRASNATGAAASEHVARNIAASGTARKPSEIVFAKARMLYARAALNAHGQVQFGLRHIRKCRRRSTDTARTD